MKLKFTLQKDAANNGFTITEAGEMDLGSFAKIHEEHYELDKMVEAAQKGEATFIELMRRRNLFPPYDLAQILFQEADTLLKDDTSEKAVLDYEDIDALPSLEEASVEFEEVEDEEEEIGDLLKDEADDLSEDDIKEIDSDDDTPRFIADDDSEHEN